MGMFDNIKVHPKWTEDMPPKMAADLRHGRDKHLFQTKDLDETLQTYRLDENGQLWLEETTFVDAPGTFMGKAERATGNLSIQDFTGDIVFYTCGDAVDQKKSGWYEKQILLVDGKVIYDKLLTAREVKDA